MTTTTMEVAEAYSPERAITMAREIVFSVGLFLDLTTADENGQHWNLDSVHMRNKATRLLLGDAPALSIGSFKCTEFSQWMHTNHPRMPKEVVEERLRKS